IECYFLNSFICDINVNYTRISQEKEEIIGVMKICNPFSGAPNYTYIPQSCPHDAVRIGDLPK
ncbi:hypothetical protein RYX36_003483, partial [Vicia faba]